VAPGQHFLQLPSHHPATKNTVLRHWLQQR